MVETRTQAQLAAEADKIKKYESFVKKSCQEGKTPLGAMCFEACRNVLEEYPLKKQDPTNALPVINTADVVASFEEELPPPSVIFAPENFLVPTMPAGLVVKVLKLYGATVDVLGKLQGHQIFLTNAEKNSGGLKVFLFLACTVFHENVDLLKAIIVLHRNKSNKYSADAIDTNVEQLQQHNEALSQAIKPEVPPSAFASHATAATQEAPGSSASTIVPPISFGASTLDAQGGPAVNPMRGYYNHENPHVPLHRLNRQHKNAESHHRSNADDEQISSKRATAVRYYFKEKEFTGEDHKQALAETIMDYDICASHQNLTPSQKATFFVNCFAGVARRHYVANTLLAMTYEQKENVMRTEYESAARKLTIQAELDNMSLSKFMRDKNIASASQGLTEMVNTINLLFPQIPHELQSDTSKVRYLRRALMEQPWARESLKAATTKETTFTQLVTALQADIQFENESKDAIGTRTHILNNDEGHEGPPVETDYGTYGGTPRFRRRERGRGRRGNYRERRFDRTGPYNPYRQTPPSQRGRPASQRKCFGCGSPDHIFRDMKCDPDKIVAHYRKQLSKAAGSPHNQYLTEACKELVDQVLHAREHHQGEEDPGGEEANDTNNVSEAQAAFDEEIDATFAIEEPNEQGAFAAYFNSGFAADIPKDFREGGGMA